MRLTSRAEPSLASHHSPSTWSSTVRPQQVLLGVSTHYPPGVWRSSVDSPFGGELPASRGLAGGLWLCYLGFSKQSPHTLSCPNQQNLGTGLVLFSPQWRACPVESSSTHLAVSPDLPASPPPSLSLAPSNPTAFPMPWPSYPAKMHIQCCHCLPNPFSDHCVQSGR